MAINHVNGKNVCPVLALSFPVAAAAAAASAAAAAGQDCEDFAFSLLMEGGKGFDLGAQESNQLCSISSTSSSACSEVAAHVRDILFCQ
jgi:hypothetical protein